MVRLMRMAGVVTVRVEWKAPVNQMGPQQVLVPVSRTKVFGILTVDV